MQPPRCRCPGAATLGQVPWCSAPRPSGLSLVPPRPQSPPPPSVFTYCSHVFIRPCPWSSGCCCPGHPGGHSPILPCSAGIYQLPKRHLKGPAGLCIASPHHLHPRCQPVPLTTLPSSPSGFIWQKVRSQRLELPWEVCPLLSQALALPAATTSEQRLNHADETPSQHFTRRCSSEGFTGKSSWLF